MSDGERPVRDQQRPLGTTTRISREYEPYRAERGPEQPGGLSHTAAAKFSQFVAECPCLWMVRNDQCRMPSV